MELKKGFVCREGSGVLCALDMGFMAWGCEMARWWVPCSPGEAAWASPECPAPLPGGAPAPEGGGVPFLWLRLLRSGLSVGVGGGLELRSESSMLYSWCF